ncbi:FAD-binding oxidoreductase [Nocardiopsis sp. HNM0947]|uniref:FAD-binding oxidoreductase n=1 Tax=Nocardiopsis coralli TaxID=2772213 RepID=A0ABR9P845_9ACTN|nr:FAD-binding oxidoreductase [Nocardiopsis coralli]MBE3000013.1 FAD-binding oxidoreductase [Nocardiopsis coralli]
MTVLLCGWGRTAPSAARVVRPRDAAQVARALAGAGPRGALPRGLGRAYGDAAQDAGGTVLDCTGLTGPVRFDAARGQVTAPAGVPLGRIADALLPHGHVLPVVPGTGAVTLGGAIAADVHGKNHHVDSSLGAHVRSLTLVTPDGSVRRLGPGAAAADGAVPDEDGRGGVPAEDPELFWATVGGMGLTGVVTEATVATLPVDTAFARVDTDRTGDLDATLELLSCESGHRYSVAWVDLAGGGRSVVSRADHACVGGLPLAARREPLRGGGAGPAATVPFTAPRGLFNRWTVGAFNRAYYHRAPRRRRGQVQPLAAFFHPLDGVRAWNRAYGPAGAVQYQCVVPQGEEDTLRAVAAEFARVPTFLGVLKRFGQATPGPLSFPRPGWTLAVDVPADLPGLRALLDRLDRRVLEAGGRLYLAKDARARPETVHAMYPGLPDWRRTCARADPDGVMVSDLARRLELRARPEKE